MIGAAIGASKIPQNLKDAVLLQNGFQRKGGPQRPAFLVPTFVPDLIPKLVDIASESLLT